MQVCSYDSKIYSCSIQMLYRLREDILSVPVIVQTFSRMISCVMVMKQIYYSVEYMRVAHEIAQLITQKMPESYAMVHELNTVSI